MATLFCVYSKTINSLILFFSHFNFTFPMVFSSSTNFFHFPISISPSNSNNYNSAASFYTTSCPPSPPPAKCRSHLYVKCNGDTKSSMPKNDDDNDNDDERLKRVHKLYEVIKNKNMNQLSEVLADECPNAYNSIPLLRIFRAQLRVLEFFSHFTKTFGNNLKFTAKPTTKNGSMVGVKWKLGWEKSLMKLGHGVNIQSYHSYVGKLLIGNLERIMDPFVQPNSKELRNLDMEPKQRRVASLYLGFFLFVLSLFFFQFSVR